MDTMNPNQMPPMPMSPAPKASKGPLIAVIIVLILIVVGGLYFLREHNAQVNYVPPTPEGDQVTASLKQQSSSDDLNSIEADLKASDFDNLDQGAAALQAEM